LLFTDASSQTLDVIKKELSAEERKNPRQRPGAASEQRRALVAGLVIGSPDFQRK
jgi:hypothetical protein